MEGLGNDLNTEEPMVFTMDEEEKKEDLFVNATSEGGDAPQVTIVDDCLVAVAVGEARPPSDEYETDSRDDFSEREDKDTAPVAVSKQFQNTLPRLRDINSLLPQSRSQVHNDQSRKNRNMK